MIVAIMQPYFFPYIGYFQLMRAVDRFVIHDDVQFIKGGWINRNRILIDHAAAWWTYPVAKSDFFHSIRERVYIDASEQVSSMLRKLEATYRRAPQFKNIFPLICSCFGQNLNVAEFNQGLLKALATQINITCDFVVSSQIEKDNTLTGQDRVINICHRVGATHYINPIGGLELYDTTSFSYAGIDLRFLKPNAEAYAQLGREHVPFLSIIDVLMFNGPEQVETMLNDYTLISNVDVANS